MIEEMRKHKELTLCFVDFPKAFNSIHSQAICDTLPLYGIPEHILEVLKPLHINTESTVITADGETEFFEISTGELAPKWYPCSLRLHHCPFTQRASDVYQFSLDEAEDTLRNTLLTSTSYVT